MKIGGDGAATFDRVLRVKQVTFKQRTEAQEQGIGEGARGIGNSKCKVL